MICLLHEDCDLQQSIAAWFIIHAIREVLCHFYFLCLIIFYFIFSPWMVATIFL